MIMEHTVIQPDESQTFLFKYGPYGDEHYFTAQEILQKMRAYYQQDFDSIVLLPYAYDAFGYFIAGCQIWDGSTNEIYLQNEELMSIGYDYVIAVRPLYSNTMPMCAFGTDGQTSYSFGTTSMGTYYDGPPDYYIWNCFRGDYPVPFVFYTECDCPHIFINGTEYHSGDATVRVNYYLPDSDYEYARLTYKKNDKPESVNDGTIVPISPSDSYIDIENLVEGKSYYFKIFTNKSESEAFPYTVGEMERPFYILPKLSAKFKIFCSSGTDVELSVQEIYDKLTTSGQITPEEAKTFILYQTTSARGYVIGLFPVYTSSLKLYTKEGLSQEYTDDYITGIDYDNATSYSLRFYLNTDLTLHSLGYGSTYLTSYKTINDVWISAWGTSITGAIMPIVYCNINPSEYSSIYLNDKQISVNVN